MKKLNKLTQVFTVAVVAVLSLSVIAEDITAQNGSADGTQPKVQQRLRDGSGAGQQLGSGSGNDTDNQIRANGNGNGKKAAGKRNGPADGTQPKVQQRLRDGSGIGQARGNGACNGIGIEARKSTGNGQGRNRR